MELMDRSLEELYHLVYDKLKESIPELVIGKMALSVRTTLSIASLKLFSSSPSLSLSPFLSDS